MDGLMQMLDMALAWALGMFVLVTVFAAIKIRDDQGSKKKEAATTQTMEA